MQGFLPLSTPKMEIGLNESQRFRFYLWLKKNKFVFFFLLFLTSEKDIKKYPWEFLQYNIKLKFALIESVFWSTIFIFA